MLDREDRTLEVTGSNPVGSTTPPFAVPFNPDQLQPSRVLVRLLNALVRVRMRSADWLIRRE